MQDEIRAYNGLKLASRGDVEWTVGNQDNAKVGIRYNDKGLSVAYQYEDVDWCGSARIYGNELLGANREGKQHFFNLGYKFGNTLIAGNYGMFSGKSGDGIAQAIDSPDIHYFALGLKYFLDKRVSIYGGYIATDIQDDDKYVAIGAGMRFDF